MENSSNWLWPCTRTHIALHYQWPIGGEIRLEFQSPLICGHACASVPIRIAPTKRSVEAHLLNCLHFNTGDVEHVFFTQKLHQSLEYKKLCTSFFELRLVRLDDSLYLDTNSRQLWCFGSFSWTIDDSSLEGRVFQISVIKNSNSPATEKHSTSFSTTFWF